MQNFITQNLTVLLGIAVILTLVVVAILKDNKDRKNDKAVLRHTIDVNLGILRREYSELTTIADRAQPSIDVTNAKILLSAVAQTNEGARTTLQSNSRRKLQDLLTEVFGAMSKSTQARHLLGACQPFTGWR